MASFSEKADPILHQRAAQPMMRLGLIPAIAGLLLSVPALIITMRAMLARRQQMDRLAQNISAPVTYVTYYIEQGGVSQDMEVDQVWIRVPQVNETSANGVFASSQFSFQRGQGGYMGTQVKRKGISDTAFGWFADSGLEHRVMFSVWDGSPEHRAVRSTDSTSLRNCERFSGEGTGTHCSVNYPMPQGKVTVRIYYDGRGDGGDLWTGVMRVPATGDEVRLGSILLPDMSGDGFGMLEPYRSNSAFQEYWDATGCEDQALSIVGIIGPYFNSRSVSPSKVQARYNEDCMRDDVSACIPGFGCGHPRVLMTAGGRTTPHAPAGPDLWASEL